MEASPDGGVARREGCGRLARTGSAMISTETMKITSSTSITSTSRVMFISATALSCIDTEKAMAYSKGDEQA